jgi:nicotinate-nucleotide--dimethylbenzimidazole phosphoribosyltransferase
MMAAPDLRAALRALVGAIRPPERAAAAAVQVHLDALTKPRGSLGRLEDLALKLACIYGDPPPLFRRRTVYVLAADHGVARRGVSAYPAEVTAQMCRNYVAGGAAVCAMARAVGAEVVTVDMGVDADLRDLPGLVHRKVRHGTRDLADGPALTGGEVVTAVLAGAALVDADPPDVVALGDMGIGNTTAASAITGALTGASTDDVVGLGTGVDAAGHARKREAVVRGLTRLAGRTDPFDVLMEVGGLEIAGLVGVVLGAARARRAVVTDGFITTAAALLAVRLCPSASDYLVASHRSCEFGHTVLLTALGLRPAIELDMRLGEGTGAVLMLPVLDAAAAILRDMATFEAAGVSRRTGGPG